MQDLGFKSFLENKEGIDLYQIIEQENLELPAWI